MFSKAFDPQKIADLLTIPRPSTTEVKDILAKSCADLQDIARLMRASQIDQQRVVLEAFRRRSEVWGGLAIPMPPLYISDGDPSVGKCLGSCIYCPWGKDKRRITRMSPQEAKDEAEILIKAGHGDIELVAAADPELMSPYQCAEHISATKEAGARNVGANFFPLAYIADYRILADAGLDFSIVWQETYDKGTYQRVHREGCKSDMKYRLDAHDRALQAGIKTVGVAFLGGLFDWKFDALATMAHAQYLQSKYGANIIVGTPRLKSPRGSVFKPSKYTDKEFIFVGALYSLYLPSALLWWSTRESFDLSARAAQGGGCLFTLLCSTRVGGYSKGRHGVEQFPVVSQALAKGVGWLSQLGYSPQAHLPW